MVIEQERYSEDLTDLEVDRMQSGIQFQTFFPSKIINTVSLHEEYGLPNDEAFFKRKYGPLAVHEADPATETYVAEDLAERLVKKTGITPDIIIVTTSHLPPFDENNEDAQRRANQVRRHLATLQLVDPITPEKPQNTQTISAACSSSVVALDWLYKLNPVDQNVLLVAEETGYRRTLPPPQLDQGKSRLLFSDAAIAMQFTYGKDLTVLASMEPQYQWDEEGLLYMCVPDFHPKDPYMLVLPPPKAGHFTMNGPGLFEFFGHLNSQVAILENLTPPIDPAIIGYVLEHQASSRMVNKMGNMGFESARGYGQGIYKYGNTSSASIFFDLMDALEDGKIEHGDNVLMVAYGGGLTWGANVAQIGSNST